METQIMDFMGILVVGTLVSLVVQFLKNKFGTDTLKTKLMVLGLSLVLGGLYIFLRSTPIFQTVVEVLMSASTIYALVLKKEK